MHLLEQDKTPSYFQGNRVDHSILRKDKNQLTKVYFVSELLAVYSLKFIILSEAYSSSIFHVEFQN